MVRVCKVHRHPALLLETLPVGKLRTVVERERLALLLWNTTEVFERKRREEFRSHLRKEEGNEISAPAVDGVWAYVEWCS